VTHVGQHMKYVRKIWKKNIQNYFLKKIKKVLTILKVFFFFF
jgi:hypothetical protein